MKRYYKNVLCTKKKYYIHRPGCEILGANCLSFWFSSPWSRKIHYSFTQTVLFTNFNQNRHDFNTLIAGRILKKRTTIIFNRFRKLAWSLLISQINWSFSCFESELLIQKWVRWGQNWHSLYWLKIELIKKGMEDSNKNILYFAEFPHLS